MKVQAIIEKKISDSFDCVFLSVENESFRHAVPANSETHFKVTVVSDFFSGKLPLARHRVINELLAEQLQGPVHALSMHTYTPQQWEAKGNVVPASIDCMGAKK